jgi:hypothetical protein
MIVVSESALSFRYAIVRPLRMWVQFSLWTHIYQWKESFNALPKAVSGFSLDLLRFNSSHKECCNLTRWNNTPNGIISSSTPTHHSCALWSKWMSHKCLPKTPVVQFRIYKGGMNSFSVVESLLLWRFVKHDHVYPFLSFNFFRKNPSELLDHQLFANIRETDNVRWSFLFDMNSPCLN